MSYDYDKLKFYRVRPSAEPTGHRAVVSAEGLINGPPIKAGVLLALDLGSIDSELAGTRFPFLELAPFVTSVDLKLEDDGRYTVIGPDGKDPAAWMEENDSELEESIAEILDDIVADHGITPEGPVVLDGPIAESDSRAFQYCRGEDIYWCQSHGAASYGVDGPQWLYAGCVQADFYFGTVYGFFDRRARIARLVFECT